MVVKRGEREQIYFPLLVIVFLSLGNFVFKCICECYIQVKRLVGSQTDSCPLDYRISRYLCAPSVMCLCRWPEGSLLTGLWESTLTETVALIPRSKNAR